MYKEIDNYSIRGVYPFHMPGHKGRTDFFPPNMTALDLTEIPGMDVLSEPTGIIRDFQKKVARIYGAEESFFLTNGASAGVIAAICATCADGNIRNSGLGSESLSEIYVARNAHVSAHNALVFCGAYPRYFLPEITADGLVAGISPNSFEDLPHGAVVFLVCPTYEGFVSDIAQIAEKVHSRDGILIVDEAHGAHFVFHKFFPKSALSCGADIVINSLHKTLPAISGCAVLHVNSTRVDLSRIRFYVNAMQTTSPSYMMMAACDFMLSKLRNEPNLFDEYVARLDELRRVMAYGDSVAALRLCSRERIGKNSIFDMDGGKLLFAKNTSLSAEEISYILAREYKIQFEMASGQHLLAMTSVADTVEGFERLKTAVRGMNSNLSVTLPNAQGLIIRTLPEIALTPREAMLSPHEVISSKNAVGRISAELIAEYPPGIAILAPGERIHYPPQKTYVRVVK